jgi:hypothetical protein
VAGAARDVAPRSAVIRLAWALCLLSVLLAVVALLLAAVNGLSLLDLIADHHAIGIMDALVLAPIGALIVVGDRRHLLAWLLLVDGLVLGALSVAEQYAPLTLGLTPRGLSLPVGSWRAGWRAGLSCPASSSAWCSWCCCSPTGGCRRAAGGRSGWPGPSSWPCRRSSWPSAPGRCAARSWSPRKARNRTLSPPCSGSRS